MKNRFTLKYGFWGQTQFNSDYYIQDFNDYCEFVFLDKFHTGGLGWQFYGKNSSLRVFNNYSDVVPFPHLEDFEVDSVDGFVW